MLILLAKEIGQQKRPTSETPEMSENTERTMARILADIAEVGPFLPGSVRRDRRKHVNKKGETVTYDVQPRLNYRVGNRRRDKRFPAEAYGRVVKLTQNYKRFKALVGELEEAAVREHLPDAKKKQSRRSGG